MVGNYILAGGDIEIVCGIESLEDKHIHTISTDAWMGESYPSPNDCNPIPLSALVLEACGFDRSDNETNIDGIEMTLQLKENYHDHTYFKSIGKLGGGLVVLCLCRGNYFRNNISFLHDLQNTFFIITGQPLEIDLQKLKNAIQ